MTQTVNKAHLTVTADNHSKTYDGAVFSPFTATITGFVLGQNLATSGVTGSAGFTGAATTAVNAGGPYTITPNAGSLSATNYDFTSFVSGTLTITSRALQVTATGVNKVYDGTTAATVTLSDDRVSGDTFTESYASATFDTKNIGTAKPVSVSGISISGGASANYTLASTTASTTATITPKALTGSITAANKVYDGTATATIVTRTLSGLISAVCGCWR